MKESKFIACKSVRIGSPIDGYEIDCGYPKAEFECPDCVCCGGNMNPITGKAFPKRALKRYRRWVAAKRAANARSFMNLATSESIKAYNDYDIEQTLSLCSRLEHITSSSSSLKGGI